MSCSSRPWWLAAALLTGLLLLVACGSGEPPEGRRIVFPDADNAQPDGSAITLTAPTGWVAEPPQGTSRKAQFRLPGEDGADAEVVVFVFPGGGGSTQANIDRWVGQFSNPDGTPVANGARISSRQVDGMDVALVDVAGTYSPTMRPGESASGPLADRRLLGAVIETGGDPWFVRLIGPATTVGQWESSFHEYIDSASQ